MILSKIYVQTGQWGKALGAAQHSLNAISDTSLETKKDDKTLELVRTIRSQVEDVKEQLHDHLSKPRETASAYKKREPVYLPIYEKTFEKDNITDELILDKKYAHSAEFVFLVDEKNAVGPTIKKQDLVLIRPLASTNKKEIVLVMFQDTSISEFPIFMYLMPEEDHFYLASPYTQQESLPLVVVVLDPHVSQEKLEPLYTRRNLKPKYVRSQDVRIYGKVVSIIRSIDEGREGNKGSKDIL